MFAYSGVQHILGWVFVLFFFVLCDLYCQFLWIVHFLLSLRYSLTFISSTNKTDLHDITEILLKVALNTITLTLKVSSRRPLSCRKAAALTDDLFYRDHCDLDDLFIETIVGVIIGQFDLHLPISIKIVHDDVHSILCIF